MRIFASLVLIAILCMGHSVSAFTTQKQDRKLPAFKSVNAVKEDVTTESTTEKSKQDRATRNYESASTSIPNANMPAFGIVNGAAVAYGPYYYSTQLQKDNSGDGDEESVTVSTAVISCLLSLILGFGLGYGT